MKEDCIFCKIVNGKIPSMKVYEDDVCLAYLDINPDSDGHTLIIPKKHYTDIYELPKEVLQHIFDVAKTMMNDLKGKLNTNGVVTTSNNDELIEVLKGLGYKLTDILKVVRQVNTNLSLEDQIKEALKLFLK